jgi:hypothetical protein
VKIYSKEEEALHTTCHTPLIRTATPALGGSTDQKWIYVEYRMKTQLYYKTVPSAASSKETLLIGISFYPPYFLLDKTFNI